MEQALEFYGKHAKDLESKDASKPDGGESAVTTTTEEPDKDVAGAADDSEPSLFKDSKDKKVILTDANVANPDDINVEEPEEEISTSEFVSPVEDAASENGEDSKKQAEATANVQILETPHPTEDKAVKCGESSKSADKQPQSTVKEADIKDYIRSTRGLSLETLAICLIPVHGVALTKSIDLTVLTDITLLSVGQQGYFWILLAEENIKNPLPLKKIHTDDVSWSLLSLLNQLKQIDE